MVTTYPIEAVEAGNSADALVDAFLADAEKGWILNPNLMSRVAHVPHGLLGWRRMVEGVVGEIGPVMWEVIAHRTAVVTGIAYETTHADATVRREVDAMRPALRRDPIDAAALTRRHHLAAALAEGVARHEVEAELFRALKAEFTTREQVGLCMAAALAHAAQLISDTLGVSPEATAD